MFKRWMLPSLALYLALICAALYLLPAAPAAGEAALPERPVFVLDAGHGGVDGGASTAAGEKESDINLAIVLRTEQLMAFCGRETVLTRREDVSIHDPTAATIREKKVSDLKNRVALVNGTENGILISVHQNSFTDPQYQGAQVFYSKAEGCAEWGVAAQELLRAGLDPSNLRAAKPAPESVYLMARVTRPALLVECGFLTGREEAALLLTDVYQRRIALSLTAACGAAESIFYP